MHGVSQDDCLGRKDGSAVRLVGVAGMIYSQYRGELTDGACTRPLQPEEEINTLSMSSLRRMDGVLKNESCLRGRL